MTPFHGCSRSEWERSSIFLQQSPHQRVPPSASPAGVQQVLLQAPGCFAPSLGSCPGTSRVRAAHLCVGPAPILLVPLGDTRAGLAAGAGLPGYELAAGASSSRTRVLWRFEALSRRFTERCYLKGSAWVRRPEFSCLKQSEVSFP